MNLGLILKNIISLSAGEFFARLFNLITYAYLARVILPEGFGSINFAAALISFFLLAVNYGFDTAAIRDISTNPEKLSNYLINVTLTKIILALISYTVLSILVSILNTSIINQQVILIYGLSLFSNAIMMGWAYQALEETLPLTIAQLFAGVLNLIAVVILIHNSSQLIETIWILVISGFINSCLIIIFLYKYVNPTNLIIDPKLIKNLFKESSPIALSLIMICIYYNLDQVMLGFMASKTDVAFYSAGYKIFLVAIIPSSIILNAFFPQLSKAKDDIAARSELMKKYSVLMFGGGMFIAMIGILFSEQIILNVFGTLYKESVLLFSILMINSILVFINMTYGNPLLAWKMDKKYLIAISAGAFSNIILNFLLIPYHHAIGAVIATICSEVLVLFGVAYYHYSFTQELYLKKLFYIAGLTTCSFMIGKLILVLIQNWFLALSVVLVIHPFFIFISGLISFKHFKRLILHEI